MNNCPYIKGAVRDLAVSVQRGLRFPAVPFVNKRNKKSTMENCKEIWKDILGFEDYYQVSNLGRVKSIDRWIKHSMGGFSKLYGRILKPQLNACGYHHLRLCKNGNITQIRLHRLVGCAFIPNPNCKPIINHKNGIKTDNRVENLEWCTVQENFTHASLNGLMSHGENHPASRLTYKLVRGIKIRLKNGQSQRHIASIYSVSKTTIANISQGRIWKRYKSHLL